MNERLLYCKMSKYAQSLIPNKKPEKSELFTNEPIFLDKGPAQGFIVLDNNKLVISFSGSNELKDWITNFKAYITPYYCFNNYCGKVHSGFIEYYNNIRSIVQEEVTKYTLDENIEADEKEIVFCGYSLGGSCVLAALDVSYIKNCPKLSVYTYGSPKVGDKTFSRKFKEQINISYRFVNDYDIIPSFPSPFKYKHVDGMVRLATKYNFFKSIFYNPYNLFLLRSFKQVIKAHSIDEYITKLIKI